MGIDLGQLVTAAITGGLLATVMQSVVSGVKDRRAWGRTRVSDDDALRRSRLMWRDLYYTLRRLLHDVGVKIPDPPDDPYPPDK